MDLFLTSVSESVKDIPALKKLINKNTKLIVLPFAHDFKWLASAEDVYKKYSRDYNSTESIFYKTVKPFTDIGIDLNNIIVINRFTDPIKLIKYKLLSDNTIVFLPGGRPENIMIILKELNLINTIKKCNVVVGESAGSMIWSKHYFVYPDPDYDRYRCFKGLGLIKNCVFIPHCTKDNYKHIIESARKFTKFHRREPIYLVDDGGWIHYNKQKEIVGYNKAIRYKRY